MRELSGLRPAGQSQAYRHVLARSFGLGSNAEIQIDGGSQHARDHEQERRTAVEHAGTDRHVHERRGRRDDRREGPLHGRDRQPAGNVVRFYTRLPNAGNESGLGLDTTDFHFGFGLAKTVQSVRVVGIFGFGILPDPVRGDRQNDVLDYGLSVARAVRPNVEVVGEINGRKNTRSGEPPIGTESRSVMRVGARADERPGPHRRSPDDRVTDRDPTWGFTAGVTYVFKAFNVQ